MLSLFWSYRAWIAGESYGFTESVQNMGNILFFVPYGYLCSSLCHSRLLTVLTAVLFSLAIELLQYIFALGWCELDDLISNSLGAFLGFLLYVKVQRIDIINED